MKNTTNDESEKRKGAKQMFNQEMMLYSAIGIIWGCSYHALAVKKVNEYNLCLFREGTLKFTPIHFVIVLSITLFYPLWLVYWIIDGIISQF